MRKPTLAAVLGSLMLLSACGAEAEPGAEPAPDPAAEEAEAEPGAEPAPDPAAEEAEAEQGTEPAPDPTAEDAGAAEGESDVLIGRVGTPEDPEAFVISLTDEAGEPVETLPAGDYTIEVTDPAEIHNFHLLGGTVDESTTVPGTVETTWEVTLEEGEYTYRCDPHPSMTGTFTVT